MPRHQPSRPDCLHFAHKSHTTRRQPRSLRARQLQTHYTRLVSCALSFSTIPAFRHAPFLASASFRFSTLLSREASSSYISRRAFRPQCFMLSFILDELYRAPPPPSREGIGRSLMLLLQAISRRSQATISSCHFLKFLILFCRFRREQRHIDSMICRADSLRDISPVAAFFTFLLDIFLEMRIISADGAPPYAAAYGLPMSHRALSSAGGHSRRFLICQREILLALITR